VRGMFTGIVRHMGVVEAATPRPPELDLTIATDLPLSPGDSLAVHGVCLTVAEASAGRALFRLSAETIRRTTLGRLTPGQKVHLEPPLRLGDRLDGHIVLGHVDAIGEVVAAHPEGEGRRLILRVPPALMRYLPEKGSVAVDGVSLTVAERLLPERIAIALIPYTLRATVLGDLGPGDGVNLEVDPIARYLETLLEGGVRHLEHLPSLTNPEER